MGTYVERGVHAPDRGGVDWRAVLAALLLLGIVLAVGEVLIERDRDGVHSQVDARVESETSTIRATVEGELNQTLFLAVGLSGYVEAVPELGDDDQVEALLASVYVRSEHIRNIGLAPDDVITRIYPIEGNEQALGLDYRDVPAQYEDVRRAFETRATVLSGPLELVQGGTALINRTPVFLRDGSYWGIVSLVVDIDSLVDEVERSVGPTEVDWAVRAVSGADGDRRPVSGDQDLFDDHDALQQITIPDGSWEIAARAQDTLRPSTARTLLFRIGNVIVAASLATLVFLFARERNAVRRQARQDPLTHLPNRRHLEEQLAELISSARRRDDRFSLVFVDLDGFKTINDRHGHAAGDEVLTEVGRRLASRVRSEDVVARVGGDEFIALLPGVLDQRGAQAAVDKLADALDAPIDLAAGPVRIGASIGVGQYPDHGATASELISRVDDAMYDVKREAEPGHATIRIRYLGAPDEEPPAATDGRDDGDEVPVEGPEPARG